MIMVTRKENVHETHMKEHKSTTNTRTNTKKRRRRGDEKYRVVHWSHSNNDDKTGKEMEENNV